MKYEWDEETNMLKLDRVLHGAAFYPHDYGFIPQTLCGDGDPLVRNERETCHGVVAGVISHALVVVVVVVNAPLPSSPPKDTAGKTHFLFVFWSVFFCPGCAVRMHTVTLDICIRNV